MSLETSLELDVILKEAAGYCAFSRGQKLVEETQVTYDPLLIRRDNQRIREALACTVHAGPMPFYGVRDIEPVLQAAARGASITAQDLIREAQLIAGIRGAVAYSRSLEIKHEALDDLVSTLSVHDKTEKRIRECIDDYGDVMDSASAELREIRRNLQRADAAIADAVSRFMATHPDSVVDSIVTERGGRAVILVKASEKNTFGGIVYGDSASGQASYVEPSSLMNANNRKQEMIAKEREEIARILQELSKEVGSIAAEEIANLETLGILDCIFAKAQWGVERDAIAAELTEEKMFRFKRARHPLIDPKKVVANDYELAAPKKLLLITGPNTGGKTVSMKIVGLFTLMTYCGMPVTADEAVLPFFDHVFADIGDDQSVVASLSSFSAHIEKLADTAKRATADSLALLDEIGSGTDPREGESLAISILNELRQRGTMVIATTHYGRLKTYGKRHDDILLASVQFDLQELRPTYRYLEGFTGQSNAFEVAERYGLPKSIIRYARFLKNQAKTQEDELIDRLEKQLLESQVVQEKLAAELAQVQEREKALAAKEKQLEHDRETLKIKAEEEAEQYLEEKRQEADEILAHMRSMQENAKYHEVLAERKKLKQAEPEYVPSQSGPHEYEAGDTVELISGGQAARVIEVRKKDMLISLNGREVRVRRNQVRPSLKVLPKEKPEAFITVQGGGMFDTMPTECNLIGMHVDEAIETMLDYISEAKVHGLHSFRIIHGDGSGALRKAVHARLARDKAVESFRLGMPQEGGTGATVVEMKH